MCVCIHVNHLARVDSEIQGLRTKSEAFFSLSVLFSRRWPKHIFGSPFDRVDAKNTISMTVPILEKNPEQKILFFRWEIIILMFEVGFFLETFGGNRWFYLGFPLEITMETLSKIDDVLPKKSNFKHPNQDFSTKKWYFLLWIFS